MYSAYTVLVLQKTILIDNQVKTQRTCQLATIGVYGFDPRTFIYRLQQANVRLLLDVRQRRGVRGTQYAWANSLRLQSALLDAGIGYQHYPQLAPTTDLRHLQYAEDKKQGVGKRNRQELATKYVERFTNEILDRVDLGSLVATLPVNGFTALLCVERDPEACHRSLIANRIKEEFNATIQHLYPG